MGKLDKILSVVGRGLIKQIETINSDLYMRAYVKHLRRCGVRIAGTPKYIHPSAYFDGNDYSKISFGDNITISRDVIILTHDYSITTALTAIGIRLERHKGERYFSESIEIGKDCFLGARTIVLPGTRIGDNVIVGAGSVVRGEIPSNCIIAGNPARQIAVTSTWAERRLAEGRSNIEEPIQRNQATNS